MGGKNSRNLRKKEKKPQKENGKDGPALSQLSGGQKVVLKPHPNIYQFILSVLPAGLAMGGTWCPYEGLRNPDGESLKLRVNRY